MYKSMFIKCSIYQLNFVEGMMILVTDKKDDSNSFEMKPNEVHQNSTQHSIFNNTESKQFKIIINLED